MTNSAQQIAYNFCRIFFQLDNTTANNANAAQISAGKPTNLMQLGQGSSSDGNSLTYPTDLTGESTHHSRL